MITKYFSRPGFRLGLVLAAAAAVFWLGCVWAAPKPETDSQPLEYAQYERATVTQILADSTQQDASADKLWRGSQLILAQVLTGQYRGEVLQCYHYVGPLYNGPVSQGDKVVLIISTYADGSHTATVYELDRILPLAILIALFLIAAVAVGGRTGAKSLVGLAVTGLCLFCILIPALFRGASPILTCFLVCCYVALVSLCILGGVTRKTLCAVGGTVAGVALAALFGLLAQALTRIDGLRLEDAEALLQVQQDGGAIQIRGLMVGGFLLSALGAVMDVAMGIASSIQEVRDADPTLGPTALFRSGMHVGRDMVGTMTNTLVLAFLGSSFTLILYLYSMDLQPNQLLSSALVSTEVIAALSSSIGVILSIPITAWLSAVAMSRPQ